MQRATMRRMQTFADFVKWAGGVRAAARLLNQSASNVSRTANGLQGLSIDTAKAAQIASGGVFSWSQLIDNHPRQAA